MQIVEQNEDRLLLRHGRMWLMPAFAVAAAGMGWILWISASRLGWTSELTWYSALAFGAFTWGLVASKLTRFEFDRREKVLKWSRRGVVPAGGTIPFARIDDVVLESHSDRKATRFHRVVLALGDRRGLPLMEGRTRDVFNCLDLLEAVRGVLGMESMAPMLAQGDTAAAARFAETRYGVPASKVEAWAERRHAIPDSGPACELPTS